MPYTADQFTNFATSTIAAGAGGSGSALNSSDLTLWLADGDGAKFPMSLCSSPVARCQASQPTRS